MCVLLHVLTCHVKFIGRSDIGTQLFTYAGVIDTSTKSETLGAIFVVVTEARATLREFLIECIEFHSFKIVPNILINVFFLSKILFLVVHIYDKFYCVIGTYTNC